MEATQDQINAATAELKNVHGILSTSGPLIAQGFDKLERLLTQAQQTAPGLDLSEFTTTLAQVKNDAQPFLTIVPANALAAVTDTASTEAGTTSASGAAGAASNASGIGGADTTDTAPTGTASASGGSGAGTSGAADKTAPDAP